MDDISASRFGRQFTIGVEEELFLVDARTGIPVPVVDEILARPIHRLKRELFACIIELTTPICRSPAQVCASLEAGRETVLNLAHRNGYAVIAAGMHPSAGGPQQIVDQPRYQKIATQLGETAVQRQLVCGLHVHIGMPSATACLRALEGVLEWLPIVLGLSANSPYDQSTETGFLSTRAGRIAQLSDPPAPPIMRTWRDWQKATSIRDYTRIWWDARPHPRLGTLEVRIADQQTSVRRSAAIAALTQALAATASGEDTTPIDRDAYKQARDGASLRRPSPDLLALLASHIKAVTQEFGSMDLVAELLTSPPEALTQLALGREAGANTVTADLMRRSEPY